MAGRRKSVLDVREMLRRLRAGDSDRRIARELSVSRVTVKKYRKQAKEKGWLEQEELVARYLSLIIVRHLSLPPSAFIANERPPRA